MYSVMNPITLDGGLGRGILWVGFDEYGEYYDIFLNYPDIEYRVSITAIDTAKRNI